MKAEVGDQLVVHGRHLDEGTRVGEIVEVHGPGGAPPFVVKWKGEPGTVVVVPGPDAHVEHRSAQAGE